MTLEERLYRVESELAIRNVIAQYGLAADCGDIETALACHLKEAVYVVSNPNAGRGADSQDLDLKGHKAIEDMLNSEMHRSLMPHCAHTVGPLIVEVLNDRAKVTGYSRVYHDKKLMRLAINHWDMEKEAGAWKIAKRESRVIGEEAAQLLLKKSLKVGED